jgi:diacylglycerol kinase
MKKPGKSFIHRLRSFKYAWQGIYTMVSEEPNARIHIAAAITVVAAGWYFHISTTEWLFVVLAIGWVIGLELVNTSIEQLADFIHSEQNERIKKIKDLAAGAVLVGALCAFIIGLIIFTPKFMEIWKIG